jgi:prephenate dehydratase-like protein
LGWTHVDLSRSRLSNRPRSDEQKEILQRLRKFGPQGNPAPGSQNERQPLYDLTEEQESLGELQTQNKGPLSNDALRNVYREILGTSRTLVKPIRVAYLGPKYSYSHLAAIDRFGDGPDLTPVATIKAVFESIHFHQTDFGVVPIENSTDGRIVDTLDMFARLPTRITGEVQLAIHHHLLGKCSRGEVTEVYSKPQALSQCREWLAKNLSGAKQIEMTSTAIAAQIAADKPGAAAIASLEAGMHYGLAVIDGEIEDNSAPHRPRQDFADVRDRPQAGVAGRRDARLQARPAQSDLDRVVPDAQLEERVPVLCRAGRAPGGFARQEGRGRVAAENRPAGGLGVVCAGGDGVAQAAICPPASPAALPRR